MKRESWIRITGIVLTLLLIVFIFYAVVYWANFPLQEVRGNVGGIFFWTGLILILVFEFNRFFRNSLDMIFYPHRFIELKEAQKK